VFVTSRLEAAGLATHRLGAEVWGYYCDSRLISLCYAGANLMPVQADHAAAAQFAERASRGGRHCSSIVGPSEAVEHMWSILKTSWGPARDVRRQPLMSIDTVPTIEAEPGVRRVRVDQLETVLPACIAMFTEEVGISPTIGDGGALYRARVAELIADGRAFALFRDDRVVFKAEVGSASSQACQIQGVWVDPELRGRGLGTRGTAAVVQESLASIAPIVSLYVNDYNIAARRSYEKVGFRQVGTFASVLF
jgi:predicted GNAT family acetyltransferase